jgi:hypothetical protein
MSPTVRRFSSERLNNLVDRITPLGLSPDEKSFVRIAYDPDSSDLNVFAVTNTATGENYSLPISKQAMHWGEYEDLSPLFVSHYFTWVKDKNGDDRLVAREHVKPLPYRGRLSFNDPDYKEFRIFLATETLRPAVIEWMIKEMGATEADTTGDYSHSVSIGGQKVYISWSTDDKHVGLWVDRGTDVSIVPKIADRLNAALATGQFDKHFVSAN